MRRTRWNRPAVESLEGRKLLSALPASAPQVAQIASTAVPVRLGDGTIQGTWAREFTNPDIGGAQSLEGGGTVRPLGTVEASGTLHTPGFIARGRTTGSLTLSNAQGSVTLHLAGTMTQPGFSGPPASFRYQVTGGTGRFAQVSGSGTAKLQERPEVAPAASAPGMLRPTFVIAPSFTLTLHAGPEHA